mgnify:CR=1 FL=1
MHSERAPFFLKLAAWGGVVFLHFPILIIAAYAGLAWQHSVVIFLMP